MFESIHFLFRKTKDSLFEKKSLELTRLTFSSSTSGISQEKVADNEIVVSLTSYGKRIYDTHIAIESIMQGVIKPNKIILWLSETEFSNKPLPTTLHKQTKRGLQIKFCKDIRSYKKIIPALKDFPTSCIITIDDDLIYHPDLVKNLVESFRRNPTAICASRIHRITKNIDGSLKSYLKWDWEQPNNIIESPYNFFTSGGGTLFPPHCFSDEIFAEQAFMKLAPTADDVWLNAMARLKSTPIAKAFTHSSKGNDFLYCKNQEESLNSINNNPQNCQNDLQIKSVFDKYNIYRYLV